ncbi:cytochrome c [Deinococcus sp. Arct2-2]|uniref:cytochrome c n=1 Tax=Deinococcus sp. Arct2-2 TaxID=2568653 RepID=UPI0010A495E4|nr:cytochrome c [Deinococcus sp. Arct2-2]THF70113.1 cytochrome c [Deinococcus sp. Arct2-2]
MFRPPVFHCPSLLAFSLPVLAFLWGATLPQAAAQETTVILSPTAAQATAQAVTSQIGRGAVLYRLACAICHGDKLEGGSAEALAGASFRATYRSLPPRAIYALIGGLHGHLPP